MPKKISPQQLEANRANARRSTGPRTPEGKAASAQNARKHRFGASDFPVPVFEGFDDVFELRADLIEVYKPVNCQELYAIERIAVAQLNLLRAARLESGLFTACLNHASDSEPIHLLNPGFGDPELEMTREQKRNFALAEGFLNLTATSQSWKFFLRYQAQNERLYRRAVEDFDRLRALRPEFAKTPNEPIFDPQPQDTTPTSAAPNEPIPNPPKAPEIQPRAEAERPHSELPDPACAQLADASAALPLLPLAGAVRPHPAHPDPAPAPPADASIAPPLLPHRHADRSACRPALHRPPATARRANAIPAAHQENHPLQLTTRNTCRQRLKVRS